MSISVYPRWRGEHAVQNFLKRFNCGLSPLARGTLLCRFHITGLPRFIPAGAGNTTVQTAGYYFFAVYPRWRGEHLLLELVECCYSGLSPLARGTLHGFGFLFDGRRFIPAGAGNTYIRAKNKATATVYPRWRGEHGVVTTVSDEDLGLSPLARGTRRDYSKEDAGDRFIPAGAGNTTGCAIWRSRIKVYPRWRGEHSAYFRRKPYEYGLSPLARGTQRLFPAQTLRIRFIPAGAGNTRRWHRQTPVLSVYPRWRGEHMLLTV